MHKYEKGLKGSASTGYSWEQTEKLKWHLWGLFTSGSKMEHHTKCKCTWDTIRLGWSHITLFPTQVCVFQQTGWQQLFLWYFCDIKESQGQNKTFLN